MKFIIIQSILSAFGNGMYRALENGPEYFRGMYLRPLVRILTVKTNPGLLLALASDWQG